MAGGTERLLQEIAAELVRQGLQVDYFSAIPKFLPGVPGFIHRMI